MRYQEKFQAENGFGLKCNQGCGGMRRQVLNRDGYKCVSCGMTNAEHHLRWNRAITIDHKDKNRKNNTLGNLQTLCLICHGRKDVSIPSLINKERMVELLTQGFPIREIAKAFGVGSSAICNARKRLGRCDLQRRKFKHKNHESNS
jgi:hypothetical protein